MIFVNVLRLNLFTAERRYNIQIESAPLLFHKPNGVSNPIPIQQSSQNPPWIAIIVVIAEVYRTLHDLTDMGRVKS